MNAIFRGNNPVSVEELVTRLLQEDYTDELYLTGNIEGGASLWVGSTGEEIWWT